MFLELLVFLGQFILLVYFSVFFCRVFSYHATRCSGPVVSILHTTLSRGAVSGYHSTCVVWGYVYSVSDWWVTTSGLYALFLKGQGHQGILFIYLFIRSGFKNMKDTQQQLLEMYGFKTLGKQLETIQKMKKANQSLGNQITI